MSNIDANGNELMEIEEVAVTDGGAALLAVKETKSGEEKYDLVWEHQAKLLRFDEGENQWKERAQGTAKILRKKDDAGLYLFIFRREAIGKLGAQHFLVKGTPVNLHPKNEKMLIWTASKDISDDDEGFPERFLMRFGTKEEASTALAEMKKAIDSSTH
ncbi:Ran-binding protein 1 [Strigomonas culicis]|uniref:Ran-binding protein 1 n=1 Tax=Strigomonas culicis TaxID=28005 RepID=S9V4N6_9TRYP|nr:Ran-binding protein 1 [Strigomonas culicis]|eukprot:EPY35848.1 Ran-binding protein 1 [Strigomonas culicis]